MVESQGWSRHQVVLLLFQKGVLEAARSVDAESLLDSYRSDGLREAVSQVKAGLLLVGHALLVLSDGP